MPNQQRLRLLPAMAWDSLLLSVSLTTRATNGPPDNGGPLAFYSYQNSCARDIAELF